MIDRPIIGQLGRTDAYKTTKVEVIGELEPDEWAEFIECLKECAGRFGNKITIKERTYRVPIRILRLLPRKKRKILKRKKKKNS